MPESQPNNPEVQPERSFYSYYREVKTGEPVTEEYLQALARHILSLSQRHESGETYSEGAHDENIFVEDIIGAKIDPVRNPEYQRQVNRVKSTYLIDDEQLARLFEIIAQA